MANEWGESAEERVGFDDSDQFDEDSMSLCSWVSENDLVGALTWRGWKRNATTIDSLPSDLNNRPSQTVDKALSLIESSAKVVARFFPFQAVEEYKPPVPEQIQLKVAYWSFPQYEDEIQLYCCLAHGSVEEFQKAELIVRYKHVQDVFQIGFHLSGMVTQSLSSKPEACNVAVTFDRCQIVSSTCTCNPNATWCAHITALCLFRIRFPSAVCFRVPVSESLSRLERNQLQKFAQYLINELPPQVLPTAQKLLDDLLTSPSSAINSLHGAPDPTAGACFQDDAKWCLDTTALHDHIRKILCKFCGPSPVAFVDLNSILLTSSAPLTSLEWSNFLRPLTSRDPEGIWNLLDIVRDLFRAQDSNANEILQILTEECLNFHQLALWWFTSVTEDGEEKLDAQTGNNSNQNYSGANVASTEFAKHTGARLLSESVSLWKVALMNPALKEEQRKSLKVKLDAWQKTVIEKARKGFSGGDRKFNKALLRFEGFMPAIIAADKNWNSFYESLGIDVECSSDSSDQGKLQKMPDLGSVFLSGTVATGDLFSCIEALYILGFNEASKKLAILLAKHLLSSYNVKSGMDQINDMNGSLDIINYDCLSEALKVASLCKVLRECSKSQHLAFKLAIHGLGLPRDPAKSKSLEVKLAHCEMTLRLALKMITITDQELELIRKYARFLLKLDLSKKTVTIPFILAIYVFEVLCGAQIQSNLLVKHANNFENGCQITDEDHDLGYRSAIITLGKISRISEVQYPMACESMRRQRNDLALSMLWHYKDSGEKIKTILSLLLNIHKYELCRETDKSYHEPTDKGTNVNSANLQQKPSINRNVKTTSPTRVISWTKNNGCSERTNRRNKVRSCDETSSYGMMDRVQKRIEFPRTAPLSHMIPPSTDPLSHMIPPSTEDWDAEVEFSNQGSDKKSSKSKVNVTGTVAGILQFDVNIAQNQQTKHYDHECYDSANDSSDGASYSSSKSSSIDLLNGHDSKPKCYGYDSAHGEDGPSEQRKDITEKSVNAEFDNMSLEFPGICDPSILPRKYGKVVVSGLADEATDVNSSPSKDKTTNQSYLDVARENENTTTTLKDIDSTSVISPTSNLLAVNVEVNDSHCSQSFDCTNEWDPALSWADSTEEKSGAAGHRIIFEVAKEKHRAVADGSPETGEISTNKNITFDFTRIESDAHALFELAKSVLSKASRGAVQNAFPSESDQSTNLHHHRGLRLAALEIGLFSLSLQNRISPKWMSRTYSSHVSWIAGQAVDIGSTALRLLNEKWEGVLTPSEVIDISNRASRLGELLLRRTAAELAVSCLPQAHTLNPGEIHQALSMCKDLDTAMLTRACSAIESASRSGGIQPEMLFLIARQWHYVHEKLAEESNRDVQLTSKTLNPKDRYCPKKQMQFEQKPSLNCQSNTAKNRDNKTQGQTQSISQPENVIGKSVKSNHDLSRPSSFTILTPEQYVQQQMHQMAQQMLTRNLSQRGQKICLPDEVASFSWIYPQYLGSMHHCPMPQHVLIGKNISQNDAISMPVMNAPTDEEPNNVPQQLQNAYRVGMRALVALANRGSEERANIKYSPSPPCSDDIRWLCALAASLGPHFLRRFCNSVIAAVSSPYLLHDVALEAARHFALYNPAQLASHLRSPCVSPIVIKCLAMYTELVRHELVLLSQVGYADFVDLLRRARSAFCMAPGGMTKFNELLEMIRRMYPKKRDLWHLIMNGLSRA